VSGTKEKANAAFKEGRYKDAIILYSEATDSWVGYSMVNSPSPAEKEIAATLYGNRAAAYLKEELFDLCLHDCESAISLNPNLYRAHIRRAWVLREQGRYEEACASLKKALLDNPNVEELKEELDKSQKLLEANVRVKVMLEKGQYTRVKQILASVEQNNKTTLFLEARAELGLGKSDIVLEKIKSKVLDDDLTNVEALTLVAQAHFQNGDFDKATQQVKNALRYGKDSSEAKDSLKMFSGVQVALSIGRNELEKKNYDRAIQGFTRAINGCNKLPVKSLLYLTLHSERAQAYRLANKLEECLEDTKKALASDGECVKTWIERVKAFQALRDFDSIVHELGPIVHKFSNKFLEEAFDEALSPPATVDFYDLFEVPRTATVEEIKKQYKLKARESHPDRFTSQSYSEEERKEAEEKFKLLGEGLELLSDSFQRSLYDTGHSIDTIRMRADALKRRQASQRHATATAS
jgi:DnaJ family protein C protein 7